MLVLSACAEPEVDDVIRDEAGPGDGSMGAVNTCGGAGLLPFEPGSACGDCGGGRWRCDGPDAVTCEGDAVNACGGCEPSSFTPGALCGPCGGVWECADDGSIRCNSPEPNACGGCEPLSGLPNYSCFNGILTCNGPSELVCRPGANNVCGGTGTLEITPGRACGTCLNGRVVCEGAEDTRCADGELGVNPCGGCAPLQGVEGEPCGCGGVWACDGPERMVCEDDEPRNDCGGCSLLAATPGASCDGGRWSCAGTDEVICRPGEPNLCGGSAPLSASPGEQCGPCGDGVVICEQEDGLACLGASELNACGGCGRLPARLGDRCGADRVWECDGPGLRCAPAPERNACGGTSSLSHSPGSGCGICGDGVWICVSREEVSCFGAENTANRCGGCSMLPPDAVPGAPCGVCFSGVWTCAGVDSMVCLNQDERTLRTWYADRDGDEFGDATTIRSACSQPIGWIERAGDCEDDDPLSYPGAAERCDGADNNCDGQIDEPWFAWPDTDDDGDGAPGAPTVQCELRSGFSRLNLDCDDSDARVFSFQTDGFVAQRRDGTWDYNCDDDESLIETDMGQCGSNGSCWVSNEFNRAQPGWREPEVPACGDEGLWLTRCENGPAGCREILESRRQRCR